jgi:hypothetical protein
LFIFILLSYICFTILNFKQIIMKKITLLLALLAFTFTSMAQVELTYNTDNVVTGSNAVGCPGGDNNWARNFLVSDFPTLPANFQLTEGEFGVQSSDLGPEDVEVRVYASDDTFPASFPGATLLATEVVTVPGGTTEDIISYTFTTPVVIPSGTLAVLVEVHTDLGQQMFIGGTADETADAYLRSDNCATPDYVTCTSIGFPDAHLYITATAEEVLAVGDNIEELVSVFPNPADQVLNVSIPSNIEVSSASLYDVLGKDTGVQLLNGQMNTSNLSRGIYILNVETTSGTLTQKIVKQ